MVSILEQAQEYFALLKKKELSASEQVKLNIYRQTVNDNGIMTTDDADSLRERTSRLDKKISAIKEKLDRCRQRYEVYKDIRDTYAEISQGDYIGKLVEEERQPGSKSNVGGITRVKPNDNSAAGVGGITRANKNITNASTTIAIRENSRTNLSDKNSHYCVKLP